MLTVIMLKILMLSVLFKSILRTVIMLSVVMLSVLAPYSRICLDIFIFFYFKDLNYKTFAAVNNIELWLVSVYVTASHLGPIFEDKTHLSGALLNPILGAYTTKLFCG
jgi:hypothetical protein